MNGKNYFPVVSKNGLAGKASVKVLTKPESESGVGPVSNHGIISPVVQIKFAFEFKQIQPVFGNHEKTTYETVTMEDLRVDIFDNALQNYIKSAIAESDFGIVDTIIVIPTIIKSHVIDGGDTKVLVDTPEVHVINRYPVFHSLQAGSNKVKALSFDINTVDISRVYNGAMQSAAALKNMLNQNTANRTNGVPLWFTYQNRISSSTPQAFAEWNGIINDSIYLPLHDIDLLLKNYETKTGLINEKEFKRVVTRGDGKSKFVCPRIFIHEMGRPTEDYIVETMCTSPVKGNNSLPMYAPATEVSTTFNASCVESVFPDDNVGVSVQGGIYTMALVTEDIIAERQKNNEIIIERENRAAQSNNMRGQVNNPQMGGNNGPVRGRGGRGFNAMNQQPTQPVNPVNPRNRKSHAPDGYRNNQQPQGQQVAVAPRNVYVEPVNGTYISFTRSEAIALRDRL